jgi:lipopolysaccharide exporter
MDSPSMREERESIEPSKQILSESKPTAKRKESTFTGDVLKLVSGTSIAQILAALFMLVLTRLFAPDAFGIYALFASIVSIISVISCFSYELSIALPKEDDDASNQLGVSILLSLITSLLLIPIIWFCGDWFLNVIKAPDLRPYLWFIPPIIFLGGIGTGHPGLNYWSFRNKQVLRQSITQVISVLVASILQLGLALVGYSTGGVLIIGALVGSAASTIWLGVKTWNSDRTIFVQSIRWGKMIEGVRRYRKFPIYTTWSLLLNSVSWQLPSFLLASYFSPQVVGFYALGDRVIKMPVNLIGGTLTRVFYPRAAEAIKNNTLSVLTESLFQRLIAFTFFPLVTLTFIGREVFIIIFGSNWAEAGEYTQILSLFMFMWFISSPLSSLYNVLEKQELILKFNIVNLVTRVLSLIIGGYYQSPHLALILFAISGIFVYGYLSLAIMSIAQVEWKKIIRNIFIRFLQFVPLGFILVLFKLFNFSPFLIVTTAGLGLTLYLIYTVNSDEEIKKFLLFSKRLRFLDEKITRLRMVLRGSTKNN